jgi:hypothetical protein
MANKKIRPNPPTCNDYMGDTDMSDFKQYVHLDEEQAVKYWEKISVTVFSSIILNTCISYKEITIVGIKPNPGMDFGQNNRTIRKEVAFGKE